MCLIEIKKNFIILLCNVIVFKTKKDVKYDITKVTEFVE